MRRRRTKDRIYIRGLRYYGDFRDFGDVGGKQEALILSGGTRATTDADEATQLVAARLKELKGFRKRGHYPEQVSEPSLEEYARYHLRAKASARRSSTVERDEISLSKVLDRHPT